MVYPDAAPIATSFLNKPKLLFIPSILDWPVPPFATPIVPVIVEAEILLLKEMILAVFDATLVFNAVILEVFELILVVKLEKSIDLIIEFKASLNFS